MSGVVRRLLTPRWLGLTLLAVVLVAACVRLGFWQLDRARDVQRSERAAHEASAVALQTLERPQGSLPGDAVGRLVTVTGRYDGTSYVVPGRPWQGVDGSWVVSILRTPQGDGVVVVRGWTAGVP